MGVWMLVWPNLEVGFWGGGRGVRKDGYVHRGVSEVNRMCGEEAGWWSFLAVIIHVHHPTPRSRSRPIVSDTRGDR